MTKIYYPYSEFIDDLKTLIKKIDQEFDSIIAIARGGMSMGLMLGEYYNIREVYSINTIGYNDTQKLNMVEVFNIPNLKNSKKVLIVDDIVDSGDTIIEVLRVLKDKYPDILFYIASLFYKKSAKIASTQYAKEPKATPRE